MKFVRFLLFPFAVLYQIITTIRNYLFDKNILKSTSFSLPVIVVGNLSVGGTGKTPQVEYLVKLLKDAYKTAILSRGYGRKTSGFLRVNNSHSTTDVGDEPLQYFKKFNDVQVAVDENRVKGIRELINYKSPEVIVLDDAFQHRKVEGSFYILLTKFNDLFTNDFLLPTGNLRERRAGAHRANTIVVTKCPSAILQSQKEQILQKLSVYKKPIFFTSISYSKTIAGSYNYTVDSLKNKSILLISGIANPAPLLDFLNEKGIVFTHLAFPDHHHFSSKNIDEINRQFTEIKSEDKIILTTEKDYTRLQDKLENVSYIEIETSFLGNKAEAFNDMILNHIKDYH